MIKEITEPFRKPSAEVMAQRELEDAKRQLLEAQAAQEYADAMVVYHAARIKRLNGYLKDTQP